MIQEVLFQDGEDLLHSHHECLEASELHCDPHNKSANQSAIK
jgi:hypothetical protein